MATMHNSNFISDKFIVHRIGHKFITIIEENYNYYYLINRFM
jgi:hypothetical protein